MQRRGHFERNQIGIDPKGPAFSIEPKRRDHRNNLLSEKELKASGINFFNFAGELVINPTNDTGRMSNDAIGIGGSEIHLGQTFHNLVGQSDSYINRELQGLSIYDPASIGIGDGNVVFDSGALDLGACTVDEHHLNIERPQNRNIEKDVREIV